MPFDLGFCYPATLIDSRRFSAERVLCASWRESGSGWSLASSSRIDVEAVQLTPLLRLLRDEAGCALGLPTEIPHALR